MTVRQKEPGLPRPLADLVFHGHFYQPPRENPWTDEVETEAEAAPFHDWNERITSECYRANAYARITDDHGCIETIVNTYELIGFNFGPTLLRWMERHHPDLLARIVQADARSVDTRGHGNAIAQTYNHVILPLADRRDRRTQIRWGLAEFRHRFARQPESLWLSETAVNDDVLGELIDHGLRYVILAPRQCRRVRESPEHPWRDVSGGEVDTSRPYRYPHRDGSGRHIALFFYHGPLAGQVSFGDALRTSHGFVDLCLGAVDPRREHQLVHVAVDGETAGHHLPWGDRALAYALVHEAPGRGLRVRNHAAVLADRPPTWEAEIDPGPRGEGTSWSCPHGVDRWLRDCGCRHGHPDWTQAWRTPLREAFDFLRDRSRPFFEAEAGRLLRDPWAARDDYVRVLLSPTAGTRDAFFGEHARGALDRATRQRALTLLEMQHQLLLMYTSCGWFFDDLAGTETVQVLRYAAHALDLWESLAADVPRAGFLEILAKARSNDGNEGSGVDVFRRRAESARVSADRVAAHLAMSMVAVPGLRTGQIGNRRYRCERVVVERLDEATLVTARVRLEHQRTLAVADRAVVALHAGGTEFETRVVAFSGEDAFEALQIALRDAFLAGGVRRARERVSSLHGSTRGGVEGLLETRHRSVLAALLRRALEPRLAAPRSASAPDEPPPSRTPCPVDAAELTAWLRERVAQMTSLQDATRDRTAEEVRHVVQLGNALDVRFDLEAIQNLLHERVLPTVTKSTPALEALAAELGFLPGVFQRRDG